VHIITKTKNEAEALLNRLKEGEGMKELAKDKSLQYGIYTDYGKDWKTKDILPPSLSNTIFSIPIGKTSQIIKTPYGFHIIKVLKRESPGVKDILEVKNEIENRLRAKAIQRLYTAWLQELRNSYSVTINHALLDNLREIHEKTKPSILFHLVLIGFVLAPHWGLAETTNRIVAKVNDDIITLHELNASIKSLTGLSCKDLKRKDKEKYHEIRRAILENLVNTKITEQQITKLGIKVTTKQVDEAIEKVKRENNITQEELVESLKSDGITLKEYREQIKRRLNAFRW